MKLSHFQSHQSEAVVLLFEKTFSDSKGNSEGQSIGRLVHKLIDTTAENDLFGFCAEDSGALLGSIFFSRLKLPIHTNAFLLSPVAVSTENQRKGIGQTLIKFGLDQICLLYTSPSPRDLSTSRMPSSA